MKAQPKSQEIAWWAVVGYPAPLDDANNEQSTDTDAKRLLVNTAGAAAIYAVCKFRIY